MNAQQARIAEDAGACAVMALERIPSGRFTFFLTFASIPCCRRLLCIGALQYSVEGLVSAPIVAVHPSPNASCLRTENNPK
eukprot:1392552-Amorphochlora_amoeboformis.AAC.1